MLGTPAADVPDRPAPAGGGPPTGRGDEDYDGPPARVVRLTTRAPARPHPLPAMPPRRPGSLGSLPVTWLHGVGYSREHGLYRADIRTVDDMARVPDVRAAAALSGLPASFIERSRIKARAVAENRVIQRSRMVLPPDDEMAIFDIETDSASTTVWMIGVLHRGRIEQFMVDMGDGYRASGAGAWSAARRRAAGGERRLLSEFVEHLGSIRSDGCAALVAYSGTGFDRRVTGAALARHGIDPGAFGSIRHIDACSLVRRAFAVPCPTYALKTLGAALGYGFAHSDMDGLDAAIAFERHVAAGTPIDPAVLEYNRDDVLSVRHILDYLEAGGFDVERRGEAAEAGRRSGGGARKAARGRRPRRNAGQAGDAHPDSGT